MPMQDLARAPSFLVRQRAPRAKEEQSQQQPLAPPLPARRMRE